MVKHISYVVADRPVHVAIMAGIQEGETAEQVCRQCTELVDDFRVSPAGPVEILLLPILSPNRDIAGGGTYIPSVEQIDEVNDHLFGLGKMVDLSILMDEGQIAAKYTDDGIKLNARGRKQLSRILQGRN